MNGSCSIVLGADLEALGPKDDLDEATKRRAALTVLRHVEIVDEAVELLAMLGLLPEPDERRCDNCGRRTLPGTQVPSPYVRRGVDGLCLICTRDRDAPGLRRHMPADCGDCGIRLIATHAQEVPDGHARFGGLGRCVACYYRHYRSRPTERTHRPMPPRCVRCARRLVARTVAAVPRGAVVHGGRGHCKTCYAREFSRMGDRA